MNGQTCFKTFTHAKEDGVNGSDFDLNRLLSLATQGCGGGLNEGRTFAVEC
jgi:hypothetical protein